MWTYLQIIIALGIGHNITCAETRPDNLEAQVSSQTVKIGDVVYAQVNLKGAFLVEGDMSGAGTSSTTNSDARGLVPIGKPKSPGLYFVRLIASNKSSQVLVVVVTNAGGTILRAESIPITRPPNQPDAGMVPESLIKRFSDSVTKNNYALVVTAAKKVAKEWFAKHVVESSATLTICILPVPGAQAVCVARVGDHVIDLGFEFVDALIDECRDLTESEKKTLRLWVQSGKTTLDLRKLIRADQKLEKLIEAASMGVSLTEFIVKDRKGNDFSVSVIGNNFVGVLDKAAVTIKVVTK